jgi:myosin protein heavy chain
VKYNNNFGFVSDDDTEINHLAQAFSYYTYFISKFGYMVSDVQGVGMYFTDPAFNTTSGTIFPSTYIR